MVVIGKYLIRDDLESFDERNGPDDSGPFTKTIIAVTTELMCQADVSFYHGDRSVGGLTDFKGFHFSSPALQMPVPQHVQPVR